MECEEARRLIKNRHSLDHEELAAVSQAQAHVAGCKACEEWMTRRGTEEMREIDKDRRRGK